MKPALRKAIAFLSIYYANMLEYRAEIFLWVLSGSLPIILMGVWIEAAQSGNFGLNGRDFARYFFAVFFVRQFTNVWVIWEFEREVIEGKLSFRLLQPADPVWHHVAQHLAEKFTRLPLAVVLSVLFFSLYPQAFWLPSLGNALLGVLAIAAAFSLSFLIQYTFSMLAFWTERASAIQEFWFLFYIFLSGLIAPLEVFPPFLQEIVQWTPFPYLVHFPASLLVGFPVNLSRSLLVIFAWFVMTLALNRWLWRRGLRHYSGMGA
jgi:ABC-2 type transport system permease protein